MQGKPCKFGDFCSYEHNEADNSSVVENDLEIKIQMLENAVKIKDFEIRTFNEKIFEMDQYKQGPCSEIINLHSFECKK